MPGASLNGHQASIDEDGMLRVVIAHEDPGIANWLDTAGHSAGPIILRCVRTETARPETLAHAVLRNRSDVAHGSPADDAWRTPGHTGRTPPRREQAVLPMTPGTGSAQWGRRG